MNKALFLDRDGIINIDHGYVYKISQFEFMEGIFDLCNAAQSKGYDIYVVTNQSGIARGYYNINDFNELTAWMLDKFEENKIHIKDVYFCPHHPHKGINEFNKECLCRKPAPGMMIRASEQYDVDLDKSILIGDKPSDMEAAQNSGISIRILVNNDSSTFSEHMTHQVSTLKETIPLLT